MPSLHDVTVRQMSLMLARVDRWIDKAVAHAEQKEFDAECFFEARLAPDMFSFARQVQSACDAAKFAASRCSDVTPPSDPDDEKTLADLKTRIQKTLAFLETLSPEQLSEDKDVVMKFIPGMAQKSGHYVTDFAQPNFYFHVTMAYAILRENGVTIGKRDFINDLRLYPFQG